MDTRSPFSRQQRDLLQAIADLGVCKDAALAARFAELEEPYDRTSIVKWRKGERTAPLGMLPILLAFAEDLAEVLNLLARPLGLRVVPDGDVTTDDRGLTDRTLELGDAFGAVSRTAREALKDGVIDESEREELHAAALQLNRQSAELVALTSAPIRVVG